MWVRKHNDTEPGDYFKSSPIVTVYHMLNRSHLIRNLMLLVPILVESEEYRFELGGAPRLRYDLAFRNSDK